jgi:hypothetical protein
LYNTQEEKKTKHLTRWKEREIPLRIKTKRDIERERLRKENLFLMFEGEKIYKEEKISYGRTKQVFLMDKKILGFFFEDFFLFLIIILHIKLDR